MPDPIDKLLVGGDLSTGELDSLFGPATTDATSPTIGRTTSKGGINALLNSTALFNPASNALTQGALKEAIPTDRGVPRDPDEVSDEDFDYLQGFWEVLKGTAAGLTAAAPDVGQGLAEILATGARQVGLEDVDKFLVEDVARSMLDAKQWVYKDSPFAAKKGYDTTDARKLGEALGSLLSFVGTGTASAAVKGTSLLSKSARIAPYIQAITSGAADQSTRMFDHVAKGGELDPGDRSLAILGGAAVGATEVVPVFHFMKRINVLEGLLKKIPSNIPAGDKNMIFGLLGKTLVSANLEGAQEVVASYLQDLIEQGTYNPNIEPGGNLWEEYKYGSGAAAIFRVALEAAIGAARKRASRRKEEQDKEAITQAAQDYERPGPKRGNVFVPPDVMERENQLIASTTRNITQETSPDLDIAERGRKQLAALAEVRRVEGETPSDYVRRLATEHAAILPEGPYTFKQVGKQYAVEGLVGDERVRIGQTFGRKDEAASVASQLNKAKIRRPLPPDTPPAPPKSAFQTLTHVRFSPAELDEIAAAYDKQQQDQNKRVGSLSSKVASARSRVGRPQLKSLSLQELRDANIPQSFINYVLRSKFPEINSQPNVSLKDISGLLRELNVEAKGVGWQNFLERTTGKTTLKSLTPTQRKVLYNALQTVPKEEYQNEPVPNMGINFSTDQYEAAVNSVRRQGKVTNAILKEATGLKKQADITALKQAMADLGVITPAAGKQFKVRVPEVPKDTPLPRVDQNIDRVVQKLRSYGLKDVGVEVFTNLKREGRDANAQYAHKIMRFSHDMMERAREKGELGDWLSQRIDHEVIHALRELDLITDQEWTALTKFAREHLDPRGNGSQTFLDTAREDYQGLGGVYRYAESFEEEAVANAFAAWARDPNLIKAPAQVQSIFRRILNFFRNLGRASNNAGLNPDTVFEQIQSGEIGSRPRGEVRAVDTARPEIKVKAGVIPAADTAGMPKPRLPTRDSITNRDEAFNRLAQGQRDEPERAMLRVQHALGGGVLNPVVEHVGDLTHRMSENFSAFKGQRDLVLDKVEKSLRYLENPYGFEREHNENVRNNAEVRGVSEAELHATIDRALQAYSTAHRKLPVYNLPQRLARDAAIAIGEKKHVTAKAALRALRDILKDKNRYQKLAGEYSEATEALNQLKTDHTEVTFDSLPRKDRGFIAYHASPHDFDQFSLDFMGTGEGAQMFGEGLYFAQSPKLSGKRGHYYNLFRSQLQQEQPDYLIRGTPAMGSSVRNLIFNHYMDNYGDIDQRGRKILFNAVTHYLGGLRGGNHLLAEESVKSYIRGLDLNKDVENRFLDVFEDVGRTYRLERNKDPNKRVPISYKVRLKVNPETEMIDWDTPIKSQSDTQKRIILEALRLAEHGERGREITYKEADSMFANIPPRYNLNDIVDRLGGRQRYSEYLRKAGAKGVYYYDAASRNIRKGTRNAVIFDHSVIEILRKNGEPVNRKYLYEDRLNEDSEYLSVARKAKEEDGQMTEEDWGAFSSVSQTVPDHVPDSVKNIINKKIPASKSLTQNAIELMTTPSKWKDVKDHYRNSRWWLKQRQRFINYADPLGEAVKGHALATGDTRWMDPEWHPFVATMMADRTAGILNEMWFNGTVHLNKAGFVQATEFTDVDGNPSSPHKIFEPLYTQPGLARMFHAYKAAKRGSRLTKEGRERFFTPDELQELNDYFDSNPEGMDIIRKAEANIDKLNASIVDMMVDSGLITREMGDVWLQNADYIPFYREAEGYAMTYTDANGNERTFEYSGDARNPWRMFSGIVGAKAPEKLKGSDRGFSGDPLELYMKNWKAAITMSAKNMAAQKSVAWGLDVGTMQPATTRDKPREGITSSPDNRVRIRVGGKDQYFHVDDPLIHDAMTAMEPVSYSLFWRMLQLPAKALRELITRSPEFILRNAVRDAPSAWITTNRLSPIPFADTAIALTQLGGPDAKLLRSYGVVGGHDFVADTKVSSRKLRKNYKKNLFRKIWDGLESATEASDLATRIAVAKSARKNGASDAQAAFEALMVMNFSAHGSNPMWRLVTSMVPFMNARIQGLDVFGRAMMGKSHPTATTGTIPKDKALRMAWSRMLFMMAGSMAYYMMVSDTEEYKGQTEYNRDTHWIIPTSPGAPPIRIPIPFEVGLFTKTFPERILRTLDKTDTPKQLVSAIKTHLLETLNFNPTPQAVVPLLEVATNYSFFLDRPLHPFYMQDMKIEDRYTAQTSAISRAISNWGAKYAGLSPIDVDHIIRGYTSTLGSYAVLAADSVARPAMGLPVEPSPPIEKLPVVRAFLANHLPYGIQERFYTMAQDVRQAARSLNLALRNGDVERADKLMRNYPQELTYSSSIESVRSSITAINHLINQIRQDPTMNSEQKRKQIDDLIRYKIKLMEPYISLVRD